MLALADTAVEPTERPKPPDVGGVRALHGNQELIAEGITRQAVCGTHPHPALPALGTQQRARRRLESITVGLAALGALGLSQLSVRHRPPSLRSLAPPSAGPIPISRARRRRATIGMGSGRTGTQPPITHSSTSLGLIARPSRAMSARGSLWTHGVG